MTKIGESHGQWINLNNDEWIDSYENQGYNGYIWTGDATLSNSMEQAYRTEPGYAINPIDYDNDGRPDFVMKGAGGVSMKSGRTQTQDTDGNWHNETVTVMTPEEYAGIQKDVELNTGGVGIPGMGDMYGWDGTVAAAGTFGNYAVIDLNGDGLTDFVDSESGCYYLNAGDKGLVDNKFGGRVSFRDFNGDGLTDYVVYDQEKLKISAFISAKDGSRTEHNLISGMYCSNNIWCRDFDGDGDVDILIPFDFANNGGSFIVLMENMGDGSFRKHENFVEGKLSFNACADIDADGCYEVAATRKDDNGKTDIIVFKIDGLTVSDTPKTIAEDTGTDRYLLADTDNSGITRLIYNHQGNGRITDIISDNKNTAPEPPTAPICNYDAATGTLKLSWSEGADKETSAADLTYGLRIGSAEGKGDMLFADALPDGTRRNLHDGNNGYSRTRTLNVGPWPAGKYYVSVQTVDPGHRGSKFSDYAVFEKKEPATGFILSHKSFVSVNDTCKVILNHKKNNALTYNWDWDGAEILSQDTDGQEYAITFREGGEKTISLQVDGVPGRFERRISVNRTSLTTPYANRPTMAFDLDGDGLQEILMNKDKSTRIFEGDTAGNYTPVRYIYNTNIESVINGNTYITDIDKDGSADLFNQNMHYYGFFSPGIPYANTITNDGGKQMTINDETDLSALNFYLDYERSDNNMTWIDIDNDGDLDAIRRFEKKDPVEFLIFRNVIFVNDGDYRNFTPKEFDDMYITEWRDYDRDGLVDIITSDGTVMRNNGDYTFTKIAKTDSEHLSVATDLDGDGLEDRVYCASGAQFGISYYASVIKVVWGDGTETVIPMQDDNPFSGVRSVYDFDNDGHLDLLVDCKENSPAQNALIHFAHDHSWSFSWVGNINRYDNIEYFRTNGDLSVNGLKVSGKANCAPAAPTDLRASQSGKHVTIEWNHSTDKETPPGLMRYNISIKHKGKTGAGAYFHSPLNSTKNGVHVPSPIRLLTSNRFSIPTQAIAPGEYEVQVQGIDGWNMQSDFSEVFMLKVLEQSVIEMPTSAGAGTEVTVRITGNSDREPAFGGDAVWTRKADGVYTVSWSSEGRKTVSVADVASQDIYIYPRPDAAFVLPAEVMAGATVNFTGSNMTAGRWEAAVDGGTFETLTADGETRMSVDDDNHATVTFGRAGRYELRHTVTDDYSSTEHTAATCATAEGSTPEISMVDIDGSTGRYRITWSADNIPADVRAVNIYKETSRYDVYEPLGCVPAERGCYVDILSVPTVTSSRYRMAYVTDYGESKHSEAHQGIHLMINRGMGDMWNLAWSRYEGTTVDAYRILGGTTPDALNLIDEVSGNVSSYSDLTAATGIKYYAVETVTGEQSQKLLNTGGSRASRSNVVSADSASTVIFVSEVVIKTHDGYTEINAAGGGMRLTAWLYPLNATLKRVDWTVEEGAGIAVIDNTGKVTATGDADGVVTIRTTAVDGSGIYGEICLHVTGTSTIPHPDNNDGGGLSISQTGGRVTVSGISTGNGTATIYVYDAKGRVDKIVRTDSSSIVMDCGSMAGGMYFVKAVSANSSQTAKFMKK